MIGCDVNMLASALVSALVDYLRKHPELAGKALAWAREHVFPDLASAVAKAVVAELPSLVDQATNLTPWRFDDDALDALAKSLANRLLPGIGGLFGRL